MVDLPISFSIAAAILFIGFLGNIFFKRTGWLDILFLVAAGIIVGPILNILPKNAFIQFLPAISTFTLLMILFRGGMGLNLFEVYPKVFDLYFKQAYISLLEHFGQQSSSIL
jgi:cell volume regulation protein A